MANRSWFLLPIVLLGEGCSYSYDVRAVVIDGRLAFVAVDPRAWQHPDCVRSIDVSTDEDVVAKSAPGDDEASVRSGTFWTQDTAIPGECLNSFPIFYGQPLKGKPFVYNGTSLGSVIAKPLRIGVFYDVTTSSSGGGYGYGRFRILADHHVENLPWPPSNGNALNGS